MYLFSLILGIVLLPGVYTLTCHQCVESSSSCSTNVCSSGSQCAAVGVAVYAGDQKISEFSSRACAQSKECVQGVQGSINFGTARTVMATKCCSTDLCNSQPLVPGSTPSSPNGNKCFTCDGPQCTGTINCLGNEDHCISTTVNAGGVTATLKGCATKEICSALNVLELPDVLGHDSKCCQGNFCNSASSTSAGLLLLVGPLISLVLFL